MGRHSEAEIIAALKQVSGTEGRGGGAGNGRVQGTLKTFSCAKVWPPARLAVSRRGLIRRAYERLRMSLEVPPAAGT